MPPTHNIVAKGDSAASQNYWREQDIKCLDNVIPFMGPSVTLPNNKQILPTNQGLIPLSTQLSKSSRTATVLPQLKSSSLISLGQICDDSCTVLLNKEKLYALKDKNITYNFNKKDVLIEGTRNKVDNLWDIPITNDRYKKTIMENNYISPPLSGLNLTPTKQNTSSPSQRKAVIAVSYTNLTMTTKRIV